LFLGPQIEIFLPGEFLEVVIALFDFALFLSNTDILLARELLDFHVLVVAVLFELGIVLHHLLL